MRSVVAATCFVLTLVGLSEATASAGEDPATATPLIARELIFGNPERAAPQLSPDGRRLAFLAPVDGVMNVWVGPAGDPSAAKPVTKDTHRGIREYFWAHTNQHILYVQDQGGDENWHVYATDLTSGETRDLTPFENVQARPFGVSHRFPDEVLLLINNRDPQLHDPFRVNLRTGESKRLFENEGFVSFEADDDYNIRIAMRMNPDGGSEFFRRGKDNQWVSWTTVPAADSLNTGVAGFDKTGEITYMLDSRGRNTSALVAIDQSGKETVIAEDARTDVESTARHPTENTIQAVAFNYERVEWKVLDQSVKADYDYLKGVAPGDFSIVSRTQDDRTWLVACDVDRGPVRYYRYDRDSHKAGLLFTSRPSLEQQPLVKMHPRVIKSGDGLELVSYLSLPLASDPKGAGKPATPQPMVLLVHGGPWARDTWGYDPLHQWLANRGYAVLAVNFRGSTGFGKQFVNAADREWAGKMHQDLIDAVDWAIQNQIADPKRVAIMGGSYGGYATLVGLTFTPETFACGVDIVGPSNLATLLASIPPYWKPMLDMFHQRVGDPTTEDGAKLLAERSPLTYVDRICRPLLIGQGANDPRVKQAEADQIVRAMTEKRIPVTYVLYPDEGHGFARPENKMSFWAVTEAFLGEHLGGRVEPVGDDFKGSSIAVPSGAENLKGLAEALAASHE